MSDSTSSTDNLSILRRGSEAAAEMFARLARGAATVLVVAVPIVVTPWGSDGYNQVKAISRTRRVRCATGFTTSTAEVHMGEHH